MLTDLNPSNSLRFQPIVFAFGSNDGTLVRLSKRRRAKAMAGETTTLRTPGRARVHGGRHNLAQGHGGHRHAAIYASESGRGGVKSRRQGNRD
jgi:hypothetical protein